MINTHKDIEIEFAKLNREIDFLKRELKRGGVGSTSTSNSNGAPTTITKIVNQSVDSELTADSSSVFHKLLHIFNFAKFNEITAKYLDLVNTSGTPQLHISDVDSEAGTYIMNLGSSTYIGSGATWNGTNWIAKNTDAHLVRISSLGFEYYYNSGLSVGASISWTLRFSVSLAGVIKTLLTASRFVKTNASGELVAVDAATMRTDMDVYQTTQVYTKTQIDTNIYTRAQVDAIIANYTPTTTMNAVFATKADHGTFPLGINTAGNHSHGGAVVADGIHAHSGSVTI